MVLPVFETVTLTKNRNDAAAVLTPSVLLAAADTYLQKLELAIGESVFLLDNQGEQRFLGTIHELIRTPEK